MIVMQNNIFNYTVIVKILKKSSKTDNSNAVQDMLCTIATLLVWHSPTVTSTMYIL